MPNWSTASVLLLLLPAVILGALLPTVFPGLLDVPLFHLAHTRIDLPLVLAAVLIPDLLQSIAVAVLERRPRYLLFAPAFLLLRVVDAAIGLYALPMAWAERSTGSWVSPQRRRVIMVGSVQVEPSDILPRQRWYAIDLDADAVREGRSADEEYELTELLERTYPADAHVVAGTADDDELVTVVRASARVPVQRTGDRRGAGPYRAVVRLADVGLSPAPSVPWIEPESSAAAPEAVPGPFRGRASVGTAQPGAVPALTRVPRAVISGRAAIPARLHPRTDTRSVADVPGITVVMAAAVEDVVRVAARHVPGVLYAYADVSRPAAAFAGGGHEALAGVLARPDGHAAEVGIDLGIDFGFAVASGDPGSAGGGGACATEPAGRGGRVGQRRGAERGLR